MARASWKYHYFSYIDIFHYMEWLSDDQPEYQPTKAKRHVTLHKLNGSWTYSLYTGKWTFHKYFTKYHYGYKLGQFTKTRKPFYFRSKKKKKKCYKKKQIIIMYYLYYQKLF